MRTTKSLLNSKLLKVVFAVFIIHIFTLSALCIPKISKVKKQKINVHTTIVQKKQKTQLVKKKLELKQTTKAPKKTPPKKVKPSLQRKLVKSPNNCTKELEKYFKDFESSERAQHKSTSSLLVPSKIDKLKIQTTSLENALVDAYEEALISYLQEKLELPSFGITKIKISITPHGKLQKLEILQSESNENIQYLKNQLHSLTYPCFNCTKEAKNFIINFSNLE